MTDNVIDIADVRDKATADREEKASRLALVRADILAALAPFIAHTRRYAADRFHRGEVQIVPHRHRGAIVIGFAAAHAMAVFHDPDGYCSGPMTVMLPDGLLAACVGPKAIPMVTEGNPFEQACPEWMHPGKVLLSEAACDVMTRMPPPALMEWGHTASLWGRFARMKGEAIEPGLTYEVSRKPIVSEWRTGLERAWQAGMAAAEITHLNPDLAGLFSSVSELAWNRFTLARRKGDEFDSRMSWLMVDGEEAPIVVVERAVPEFVGLVMPQNAAPISLPDFWMESPPAEGEGLK